jgi:hypothetical protein
LIWWIAFLSQPLLQIRHYGLLAPHGRNERLALCRRLLLLAMATGCRPVGRGISSEVRPARERCCPQCAGTRLSFEKMSAEETLRGAVRSDSS